jgi:hypothetical protein
MALFAADKAKAAEALIRHPELSPSARRLGLELLNLADKRTGTCWPSEARLALALDCDPRSIRRAKAELKAAGLLSWVCRGQHKTPVYRLAWDVLKALAATIKAKVRAAFTPAPLTTSEPSPAAVSPSVITAAPVPPNPTRWARDPGRTFLSTNLTQIRNIKGALEGIGGPPAANSRRQVLTDQQLNTRASTRLWEALRQRLAPQHLQVLIGHVTEATEAQAVKAERYQPGTGLAVLCRLVGHQAPG